MENIYHRYVKIPFSIHRPSFSYEYADESKHIVVSPQDYDASELSRFLESFDICITDMESFYTKPNGGELPIHTDMPMIDDRVKLNMTWGPEEGVTRWWQPKDMRALQRNIVNKHSYIEFSDAKHDNLLIKKEEANIVYEASTNRPSLVNVGQLHSTYNPSDEGRWTMCFILGNEKTGSYLDWYTAVQRFGYFLE